jgi:hypothetical protein
MKGRENRPHTNPNGLMSDMLREREPELTSRLPTNGVECSSL